MHLAASDRRRPRSFLRCPPSPRRRIRAPLSQNPLVVLLLLTAAGLQWPVCLRCADGRDGVFHVADQSDLPGSSETIVINRDSNPPLNPASINFTLDPARRGLHREKRSAEDRGLLRRRGRTVLIRYPSLKRFPSQWPFADRRTAVSASKEAAEACNERGAFRIDADSSNDLIVHA